MIHNDKEDTENVQEPVRFEDMPKLLATLTSHFEAISESIASINNELTRLKGEKIEWLTIDEVAEYIPNKPAKPTVYGWIQQNLIPHYRTMKGIAFMKSEIDDWLRVRHIVPAWWDDRINFKG